MENIMSDSANGAAANGAVGGECRDMPSMEGMFLPVGMWSRKTGPVCALILSLI